MPGWVSEPDGCGLMDTPGSANVSERVPDPILLAIEAHKGRSCRMRSRDTAALALDRDLPIEECRSSVTLWEEIIGATNDPRWIDCERAVMRRMNAETDAACVLVKCPTDNDGRRRGVLRYAVEADTDGEGWPPVVESDDGQPDPGAS